MGCSHSKEAVVQPSDSGDRLDGQTVTTSSFSAPSPPTIEAEAHENKVVETAGVAFLALWKDERSQRERWSSQLTDATEHRSAPTPRPNDVVQQLLQGVLLSTSTIQNKLGTRQPLSRIFLSSTFTDTENERNIVIEDVYPYLKRFGQRVGVQVYQSSEMRWGIRSDASASHQTSEICMKEIRRCQDESSGINYVLILGDKYGYRPFPAKIPAAEFDTLKAELEEQLKDTDDPKCGEALPYLDAWFELDANYVPAMRVLKPVGKEDGDAWWSKIFPTLQHALRRASAVLPEDRRALYHQSVTAEEIQHGLFLVEPQETRNRGCFVFDRQFQSIDTTSKQAKLFVDMQGAQLDQEAQSLLKRLRQDSIPKAMSASRLKPYSVAWGPGIDPATPKHAAYLRSFADDFCQMMVEDILRIAKEHHYETDAVVEEAATHALFGNVRRVGFVSTCATSESMDAALSYVSTRINSGQDGSVFALCGASGSGKTSLMASIAGDIKSKFGNAVVISRFLGTSRDSASARRVMTSLYNQIHRGVTNQEPKRQASTSFEQLARDFLNALKLATAAKPIVLVIDSLDQLNDEDQGRKLEWLPLTQLPKHCAIIVSSLPDVGGCWNVLKGVISHDHQQQVLQISADDAKDILDAWLTQAGRTLSSPQRQVMLTAYQKCPTPLYLKICTDYFALRWSHTTVVDPSFFPPSVPALLEKVFDDLETTHGKETVRAALGYISAAKSGLSDNEMEDLLSLNDVVLDEIYEWWEPPIRRVPPLIWARIVTDLEGALVERGAEGGITVRAWYHRQHREAAERRYLQKTVLEEDLPTTPLEIQRHSELADYFSGKWERGRPLHDKSTVLIDRKIGSMQTILCGRLDDPRSNMVLNTRKLAVLPYHLVCAHRWKECVQVLCSLEFVQAKAASQFVHELAGDYQLLLAHGPTSLLKEFHVELWASFASSNAHIFERTPEAVVARACMYPDWTPLYQEAGCILSDTASRLPVPRRYLKPQQLDPRIALLKGLRGTVRSITFTHDGKWLCASCDKPDIRVWDVKTATPLMKMVMPGKFASASCLVHLPNMLLAASCRHQVLLWDLRTGELVQTLNLLQEGESIVTMVLAEDQSRLVIAGKKDQAPVRVIMLKSDLSDTLWTSIAPLRLTKVQLRGDVLFASTGDGELAWLRVNDDEKQLEEIVKFVLEPENGKRPYFWGMSLLADSLDAVAVTGKHLIKVKSDGSLLQRVELPTLAFALTLVKDGSMIALGLFDDSITLYNTDTLTRLKALKSTMTGAQATSPDGLLVASGGSNFYDVTVFSVEQVSPASATSSQDVVPLDRYVIPRVALMGTEQRPVFTVAGSSSQIDVRDIRNMELIKRFDVSEHAKRMALVEISPDGRFIITGQPGSAETLGIDVDANVVHANLFDHGDKSDGAPIRVFFSPTCDVCVVANEYGSMCVLALPSFKVVFGHQHIKDATEHHFREVIEVAWHPLYPEVRQFVTSSEDKTARLWVLQGGDGEQLSCTCLQKFEGAHEDAVSGLALCVPKGAVGAEAVTASLVLGTACEESGVRLWKLGQDKPYALCTHAIEHENSNVSNPPKLVWLPNQDLLVSCALNQKTKCWNLKGELVHKFDIRASHLHLHPSLRYILKVTFGGIQFLDPETFEVVINALGHDFSQGGGSFRITSDGKYAASKWGDNAIITHDFSRFFS
eukprot:m.76209 g.76209  ORF g.76209 m.76209 type:complete len:1687 (-) comp14015_c0_seq1:148-5208(-)